MGRGSLMVATGTAVALAVVTLAADSPVKTAPPSILGRWDLTVQTADATYPSWLEVRKSGYRTLVGSFVGRTGSVRPIGRVEFADGQLRFTLPPQWEKRPDDLVFEGKLEGDTLRGETTDDQGRRATWIGRRAPSLRRSGSPRWEATVELFNGKDLAGWKTRFPNVPNGWVVRDGLLVNATPGNDLLTEQTFTDFQLYSEFRYPAKSNSGIYLRGRYEVQIEDSYGQEPDCHQLASIYGFLTPRINAAKPAGEWQTLLITLLGRTVTVVLNGQTALEEQVIPGITGGALDSEEGAPGPLLLQGDHGPIEFRRLALTPAR